MTTMRSGVGGVRSGDGPLTLAATLDRLFRAAGEPTPLSEPWRRASSGHRCRRSCLPTASHSAGAAPPATTPGSSSPPTSSQIFTFFGS